MPTTLSVVIAAYNEQENIPRTLDAIPISALNAVGVDVEVLVVDNGSTDATGELAREHGARVLVQPVKGYGNAYKAGFANCTGDIIATGDADLTYPFGILPEALTRLWSEGLDFLSTNRLGWLLPGSMTRSHVFGNQALSMAARLLFGLPFQDSQSGMWIFRRHVWPALRVRSAGMAFSQELKVEAFRRGFRCAELAIPYAPRGGQAKLRTVTDGLGNAAQLLASRLRSAPPVAVPPVAVPPMSTPTVSPPPMGAPPMGAPVGDAVRAEAPVVDYPLSEDPLDGYPVPEYPAPGWVRTGSANGRRPERHR